MKFKATVCAFLCSLALLTSCGNSGTRSSINDAIQKGQARELYTFLKGYLTEGGSSGYKMYAATLIKCKLTPTHRSADCSMLDAGDWNARKVEIKGALGAKFMRMVGEAFPSSLNQEEDRLNLDGIRCYLERPGQAGGFYSCVDSY
jgi:hypothetical protein